MPMVRTMRMLNALEAGTLTGPQLNALMTADPSRSGELNVLLTMPGQRLRIAASATTMAALLASAAAEVAMTEILADADAWTRVLNSTAAMQSVAQNTAATKVIADNAPALAQVIANPGYRMYFAASTAAMQVLAGNNSAMASIAGDAAAMTAAVGNVGVMTALVSQTVAMNAIIGSAVALPIVAANADAFNAFMASTALQTVEIPAMTSATTPSGNAQASDVQAAGLEAWRAFDKNINSTWSSVGNTNSHWLRYDFPTPVYVHTAEWKNLFAAFVQIQYSDNGSTWVDVDARASASGNHIKNIIAVGRHRYWRLYFENGTYTYNFRVGEFNVKGFA